MPRTAIRGRVKILIMTSKNNTISLLTAALLLAPALAWSAPAPVPADSAAAPAAVLSHDSALFGSQAALDTVTRTIDVAPGMKRLTVASGESVAIRAGGRTVGWTFLQSINGSAMNLAVLMPGVPQARDVYVFIEPSEIYRAG
ncbi:MAG: heavy metal resistance protein [Burkholderiaceae bacterium]|uniref:CzcE family metal-binding protein n=1 Tax=Cupriavidus metallidurans TaxID=119219 RepID=A0A482J4E5_9BURK|nr:heavy metal resistance protein [Cupriavidus sp. SHE]PCH58670.1 MAG: heavy metal resistance protein [Burkholderiaceae bacterium]QBP13910.1 CzcE family metal-binding protein [Cupriavidus metallidurans]QGS33457.1 CzcE family metal-binding protein [Cupriavidus metallidurans]QWC91691.1 CzcE family metal-binding protein [Cupriavidus metallidurans]